MVVEIIPQVTPTQERIAAECYLEAAKQEARERYRPGLHNWVTGQPIGAGRSNIALTNGVEDASWGLRYIEVVHDHEGYRFHFQPGDARGCLSEQDAVELIAATFLVNYAPAVEVVG